MRPTTKKSKAINRIDLNKTCHTWFKEQNNNDELNEIKDKISKMYKQQNNRYVNSLLNLQVLNYTTKVINKYE
jgi:hypothetical protein